MFASCLKPHSTLCFGAHLVSRLLTVAKDFNDKQQAEGLLSGSGRDSK